MMRPAMERTWLSRVAKKAACGPPKPIGMPKRWAEPRAMSAPMAPGDLSSTRAIRSQADGHAGAPGLEAGDEVGQVAHFAVVVRVLQQGAEEFLILSTLSIGAMTSSKPK